jgi:hypothetical protein
MASKESCIHEIEETKREIQHLLAASALREEQLQKQLKRHKQLLLHKIQQTQSPASNEMNKIVSKDDLKAYLTAQGLQNMTTKPMVKHHLFF